MGKSVGAVLMDTPAETPGHGIYSISGIVTIDGVPAPNGGEVILFDTTAKTAIGVDTPVVLVNGDGTFTTSVPYNDHVYLAYYNDGVYIGVSQYGAVGTSLVIAIFTGSGSSDTTPPLFAIVSPTPGSPILRFTPIVLRVTDNIALRRVFIFVRFSNTEIWETVHDGDNFAPTFPPPDNTRTSIIGPNGYEFNLLRLNGWPATPELHVIAIDTNGNMAVL